MILSLAQLNVLSVLFGEEGNFLVQVHQVHFREFFLFKKAVMEITRCSGFFLALLMDGYIFGVLPAKNLNNKCMYLNRSIHSMCSMLQNTCRRPFSSSQGLRFYFLSLAPGNSSIP